MAHQTEIVVNGVVTEVTEFDHTAQEIDDSVDRAILSLLAVAAAAAYNPSGTYVIGDYCTNDGNLYKCNTPIESGEAWNAAHWTETTVTAELAEVRASLSNKMISSFGELTANDLLNWAKMQTIGGSFFVNPNVTTTGLPDIPDKYFVGTLEIGQEADCKITLTNNSFETFINKSLIKSGEAEPSWIGWREIATATPPQEHAIVPKNGATLIEGFKNSYSKDQFGRVLAFFSLNFSNVPEVNLEIFSLPESFTPTTGTVAGAATLIAAGNYYPATVNAYTNGVVSVNHDAPISSTSINLHGFLVIDTGGT